VCVFSVRIICYCRDQHAASRSYHSASLGEYVHVGKEGDGIISFLFVVYRVFSFYTGTFFFLLLPVEPHRLKDMCFFWEYFKLFLWKKTKGSIINEAIRPL
jgi:hypothetical protein